MKNWHIDIAKNGHGWEVYAFLGKYLPLLDDYDSDLALQMRDDCVAAIPESGSTIQNCAEFRWFPKEEREK